MTTASAADGIDAAAREERQQERAVLVRRALGVGRQAEALDQLVAAVDAEHGVGVADVDQDEEPFGSCGFVLASPSSLDHLSGSDGDDAALALQEQPAVVVEARERSLASRSPPRGRRCGSPGRWTESARGSSRRRRPRRPGARARARAASTRSQVSARQARRRSRRGRRTEVARLAAARPPS